MKKQYSFKTDVMKTPVIDSIRFNQQDRNSSVLVIALTQGEQIIDLTNKQISIVFLKPDGTIVTQDELNGVSVTAPLNGTFEVKLNTEVLSTSGTVTAEITITEGTTIFVCDPFKFKVEKSLRNGAETVSQNDLTFMANVQQIVDAHDYLISAEQTIITLQTDVGDVSTLKTTAKNSAVAAVNELSDKIGILKNERVSVFDFGVLGDGSDETSKVLSALNEAVNNNKTFYVPQNLTITVSGLSVSNKSNFGIRVDGKLKLKNGTAAGIEVLKLDGCSDVIIHNFNADGNIANNGGSINEHQHLLKLANCDRITIGTIRGFNPGGDVVYINNCNDIIADNIWGSGLNTGRNTLSIIKGKRMQFSKVTSIGVGTGEMPCGVDLEPNLSTDHIEDIQFGDVYVEGIGTGSFTLYNNYGSTCRRVRVDNLIINKPTPSVTSRKGMLLDGFNDVHIKATIRENNAIIANLKSLGVEINRGDNINLDLDITNVWKGLQIGITNTPTNVTITGKIRNIAGEGVNLIGLTDATFQNFKVNQCDLLATNTNFNLRLTSAANLTNVKFVNCDFSKGSSGYRAVQLAGTMSNVLFEDCDFTGWSTLNETISGSYTTGVFRKNCRGLNYLSAIPSAYYWNVGEVIWNTLPSAAGKMGWVCTVAGSIGSGAVFKAFGAIDA